jgi:[acyl-carrier-protein] S-malonyltransferase
MPTDASSCQAVALMFPGQGSQSVGMGREYLQTTGQARLVFEEADDILGWSVSTLCRDGPEEELNRTEKAQPALLTLSVAIWRDLQEHVGFTPAVCLGHSAGEFAALVAGEAIEFAAALRCIARRGEFMAAAGAGGLGGMAAVIGLAALDVAAVCREVRGDEVLEVTNFNAPGQVVISGQRVALARAETALQQAGARRVVRLRVSVPSHCALMQQAAAQLSQVLADVPLSTPRVPVLSNVTARPHGDAETIRSKLAEQLTHPVRWEECVHWATRRGCRLFAELGPNGVLAGLVRRIDRSVEARWFDRPVNAGGLTDLFQLKTAGNA